LEDRMTLDDDLYVLVRQFEASEDSTREARDLSERCRDYFDGKQLTADEETALNKRGQPPVVFNEIAPKVKTLQGLEKQTRKDPKAFPRNPADQAAADAATDAIRFVCDASNWDDKRSAAGRNLIVEGTGAVFVGVKQTRDGIDPDIRKLPWDRFYFDPHSAEDDFTDAAYKGTVVWMDLTDARQKYPEGEEALVDTWKGAADANTYDDRPKWNLWADYKRQRVRLCEHYWRKGGVWHYAIFTKGGFVVPPQPSPYLDEMGQPECPIHAISLYVDRDNNRYGEVKAMLSPQDEINKRRSKALHIVNTRQVRVSPATGLSPDAVRKELARPDGIFMGEQGDVEVLQTFDMAQGNLNLLLDAREHIQRTGANSAMAGKDVGAQSGKAIALQQMGGMTEAADFLDCVRRLSLSVYRAVWNRIKQHWKEQRWIRVTDNESNVRFVGFNRPVTMLQAMAQQMGVTKEQLPQIEQAAQAGDEQAAAIVQELRAFAQDPRSQMVVGTENSVAETDVDIVMDEGVDTPTIQAEQFEVVAKMLPGAPPQLQPVLWKALFKNSAFRDKDEVIKAMEQPPAPEQAMMQEVQMAGAKAEVEKTQSETAKNMAQAGKMEADAMLSGYSAGLAA